MTQVAKPADMQEMMSHMLASMNPKDVMNLMSGMMPKMMNELSRSMSPDAMVSMMHEMVPKMMEACFSNMSVEQKQGMLTMCRGMLDEMEKKSL